MKDVWIKIRRINNEDTEYRDMYEARVDMLPDAAVYEDTADEAYEQMRQLIPEMVQHYIDVHGYVPWSVLADG